MLDDTADREPAILVSCLLGGRIELNAALRHPSRVRALVLIAPKVNLTRMISGEARVVVANSVNAIVRELAMSKPAVVVNTIGPFTKTALPIARASPGTLYVDLGNELPVLLALLGMHDEAVNMRRCLVPGAGWGVFATESVVLKLCEGRPPAACVRVDNLAFVDQTGPIGPTVAASVVESLAYGGRRYEGGALKRVRLGSDRESF